MKFLKAIVVVSALLSFPAHAYVPPGFFLAQKITSGRSESTTILAQVSVYRAAPTHKEADELLWEQFVAVPAKKESPESPPWPGLSVLVEPNHERLSAAFRNFGLPVATEESLARFKGDQLRSMKETPRPFYNIDPAMSLKKIGKQLAWVLSTPEEDRSLWVDKSTFFPLFLRGTCPKVVEEISWANSDEGPCELHFESISGLKTSAGRRTAAILKRGGQPLVKFVLKKVFTDPQAQLLKDSLEKNSKTRSEAGDLAPLVGEFLN